jgi:hypothetical protein
VINYSNINLAPMLTREFLWRGDGVFGIVFERLREADERIRTGEGRLISAMLDDAMDAWVDADRVPQRRWMVVQAELELIYRAALEAEKAHEVADA